MYARPKPALLALVIGMATTFGGCSSGGGPAEELRSLLETLANPTVSPSRLGAQAYKLLDEASRAAIDARAKALGDKLGVTVAPSEVLQVRGFASGARLTKIEVVAQDEARATLEISFAPIIFSAGPGDRPGAPPDGAAAAPAEAAPIAEPRPVAVPPTARIEVVRENGRWRMSLRDLAKLVGEVPLDAASAARAGP